MTTVACNPVSRADGGEPLDWVDLFSGLGGSSLGIHNAGATVKAAANHNRWAIDQHATNFPETEHFVADLLDDTADAYIHPAHLPKARALWASPSCFPAGTLILTKRGLIPIEEVQIGDEAWTHRERWRPVTAAWSTPDQPTVTVKGLGTVIESTPNHGFLARRTLKDRPDRAGYNLYPHPCENCGETTPRFKSANHHRYGLRYCNSACAQAYLDRRHNRTLTDVQRIEAADLEGEWVGSPTGQVTGIPLPPIPDAVDWWWVGRWVGDGWVSRSDVVICCGGHEAEDLAARLPGWKRSEARTTTKFAHYDAVLGAWLTEHFGCGAANKRLPAWMFTLPACDLRRFLDGYASADGHRPSTDTWSYVSIVSISKRLAVATKLIANRLGHTTSFYHSVPREAGVIEGRTVNQSPQWVVKWFTNPSRQPKTRDVDGARWGKVASVKPSETSTMVFNITVDEDHSYVADGTLVYNCTHHSRACSTKLYAAKPNLFNYAQVYAEAFDPDALHAGSERSRVTAICPILYAEKHRPDYVVVENVVQFLAWGPAQDGSQYRDWLRRWENMGYDHEALFLNSGFFGCPQSRDRVYIVLWRRGLRRPDLSHRPLGWCERCGEIVETMQVWKPTKKSWPVARWGIYRQQYTYACRGCGGGVVPAQVPSGSIIDWHDLGPTLAERDRPVADRTRERIARCLAKFADFPPVYVSPDGEAFVDASVLAHHDGVAPTVAALAPTVAALAPFAGNTYERPGQVRGRHVTEPGFAITGTLEHGVVSMSSTAATRTGGGHQGLVVPMWVKQNGGPGDTAPHGVDEPLGTVTSRDLTGLIALSVPIVHGGDGNRSRHVFEQLATLTTARERYMASAPAGLVDPGSIDLDRVRFRMLNVDTEIRKGMGFPDGYVLVGTKTQKQQGLGNAVTPPVAAWVVGRIQAAMDDNAAL